MDVLLQVYREHLLIGPEEQRGKHLPLPSPQAVRGPNINSLLARQESSTSSGPSASVSALIAPSSSSSSYASFTPFPLLLRLYYNHHTSIRKLWINKFVESCDVTADNKCEKNLEDQSFSPFYFRFFVVILLPAEGFSRCSVLLYLPLFHFTLKDPI